jgi:hypothetical protein
MDGFVGVERYNAEVCMIGMWVAGCTIFVGCILGGLCIIL